MGFFYVISNQSVFAIADQRLNDIVGSAYYVAPEVLHRSYSSEADIWSIGVITYILLCGSRPFWARTESGIFRSVLRADPNFYDAPWPSVSAEAKDFVKRLLNRDHRKRMTAAQALSKLLIIVLYLVMGMLKKSFSIFVISCLICCSFACQNISFYVLKLIHFSLSAAHPWLRDLNITIPLDMMIYRLIKSYIRATPLKRAALKVCPHCFIHVSIHMNGVSDVFTHK